VSHSIQISHGRKALWIGAFFLAASLIATLGVVYFRTEEAQVLAERTQELTAIGTLKAEQVAEWRKERLSDAIRFAQGPTLLRAIEKNDAADLRTMLTLNRKNNFYEDVLLVSSSCAVIASASDTPPPLTDESRRAVERALATRAPVLSDFYRQGNDIVHIDVAAAIVNAHNVPVAAFVLRCAASAFLYPMIQSWPVTSLSAETLLVRREGDAVVFLNKVRHQPHKVMTLKLPLTRTDVPAVQAVLGKQGIVRGTDYRGIPVLADVRQVPDSDWFIVTKVDADEVLTHVQIRAFVIIGFVLLGILLAATATAFGLRNRQASLYRDLYRVEQEQRASVEKFRTILYSIGDAVITTDDRGRVQQMNPIAENLTGWSEPEALDRPFENIFRVVNEETRAPAANPVEAVLHKGTIVGLANHTLLIARDGTERPISDSGAPISDEHGQVAGVVLVFRDQSSERSAQKALIESERRLSTLMNNLPGMAYRCRMDTYWTMEFISQGCIDLTGYKIEDLLGNERMSYFDLIHSDNRQYVWDTIAACVDRRESFTLEYRIKAADGSEKWVSERGSAIFKPDGSVEALEGFIYDITSRKQAAEEQLKLQEQLYQSQKIEAIGRLAGGVAHDFNNMLSIIIGNAELIDDRLGPTSPCHGELAEILKAVQHSASLVKQLLGFASKQNIKPRSLDLNEAINGLCVMLRRLIGETINLEWAPAPHLWPVLMDPGQIDQILVNLTVNARDAIAETGKITITTRNVSHLKAGDGVPAEAPFGDYVALSVSDDGCGMDVATQAQIFEPFFTTKAHGLGTGLGLSTVYGIVKQNNGAIRVDSQPGKGACFQIFLPRNVPPKAAGEIKPAAAAAVTPPAEKPAPPPSETILLVEDEAAVLNLTSTLLKTMGYHVIAANGPKEALQLARDHAGEIHLLLTDVVMPDMSGRDLRQLLLRERPAVKSLFMSGYTADIIAHHGMLDENIHFLQKPFTRESLAAKVRETLTS